MTKAVESIEVDWGLTNRLRELESMEIKVESMAAGK